LICRRWSSFLGAGSVREAAKRATVFLLRILCACSLLQVFVKHILDLPPLVFVFGRWLGADLV
jgi:hypothetical protein